MFRFFSIFYSSLLFSFSVFAQSTLNGKVYDADGNALVGATVQISSLQKGAITDTDGSYSIANLPLKTLTVKATSIGYKSVTKTIEISDRLIRLNFTLTAQSVKHKEIVIREDSKVQEMRKDPEPITVIDAKDIRGRATSLDHILSKAAGVKIRKSGGLGSSSRINIHGLEGKRVQLLIDGDPVNSPDGNLTLDDIPIDLIERIEIYKGIVPARFGGDGIGGAVNIVIREFEDDYIDLSYQRGSYNTNRLTWVFKKNFLRPGIEFTTGGFYNYADNDYEYQHNGQTLTRDHDMYRSGLLGLGFTFTKLWFDELEIGLDIYFNKKELQGLTEERIVEVQDAETRARNFAPGFNLEKNNFLLQGMRLENDFMLLYSSMKFRDIYAEMDFFPSDSDDKHEEIRNRLNLNYEITPQHSLNLNQTYRTSDYKPNDPLALEAVNVDVTGYPSSLTTSILGLTYETRLFDGKFVNMLGVKSFYTKTNVAASNLQYLTFQKTPYTNKTSYSTTGFSEALRYKITPWLSLKASYQHAIRVPDATEIFGDGYLVASNPDLTFEKGDNLNFGIFIDTYDFLSFYRLQFETNLYYRDITNYIDISYGNTGYNYRNLGHIKIKGIDAELKLDVSKSLYLHGNITYQDIRDVLEFEPDGTPNPTYKMKAPHKPWFFSNFGAEYHKENVFMDDTFLKVFWESSYTYEFFYNWELTKVNPRRVPTSFTHDAGLEMAFSNNSYIFSFEIQNLTDEELYNNYNMPLMGRAVFFKVRYSFINAVH